MPSDSQTNAVTSIIFRTLASIGAMAVPAIVWALSQLAALREDVINLKNQVGHVPELIEASMMREELKRVNDSLQKAIQVHEAQQAQQAPPTKGKP